MAGPKSSALDSNGNQKQVLFVTGMDPNGNALGQTYQLATSLASLASGGTTGDTAGIAGGSYIWAYQLGGTSPSLVLEALGPDGSTWITIATVTATGQQGVVLGNAARVRLRNGSGSNAITGLSSSLS